MVKVYADSGNIQNRPSDLDERDSVIPDRVTAEMDGEFVVFLIGMHVNRPLQVRAWLPVFRAMPRMMRELQAHPELGLLATQFHGLTLVQYWRSVEHLNAYAASREHEHLPAWRDFNRNVKRPRAR